ncbi:Endolytic murein transglycosylase [Candidatus Hepatincola sp. Pdp]
MLHSKSLLPLSLIAIILLLTVMFSSGPLPQDKIITIPNNITGATLADTLVAEQVISNKYIFLIFTKLFGKSKAFIKGDFLIEKHKSLIGVLFFITSSKNIYYYRITLIEGYNKRQMKALLESDPILAGNITVNMQEGSMLPDTYLFTRGETRDSIILRSQKKMQDFLDDLWENRDPTLPYKNKEEALTLASIVEEESAIKDERDLIAGLFLNRLKTGMRIQSDPTVAYGLGRDSAGGLTHEDLLTPTPYNTYTIHALPIGPISNPSRESLRAVFFPKITNYLYFVADGKGGHIFATSLQEHNANVAKWRTIENIMKSEQNNQVIP